MSQAYRGPDRRGTVTADGSPSWWLLLAAAAVTAAAAVAVIGPGVGPVTPDGARGAAAGLALAAAAVCVLRGWELGDAAALWLAAGLLPTAADLVAPATMAGAGHLVGAAAALVAAFAPDVDARLRRWWLVLLPFLGAGALAAATGIPPAFSALLWAIAALTLGVAGLRRDRALLVWFALTAAGLALAIGLDSALVAAVALGVGVIAVLRGVRHAIGAQRDRLFAAAAGSRHAEARTEAAAYTRERAAHDAQNSLTALGGAFLTLERHRDRLDEATKEQLSTGLRRELERLHTLVAQDPTDTLATFELTSALRPLRAGNTTAEGWDIPDDLVAYGRVGDTAEALRLLLAHPAGGQPVLVRATGSGSRVRIEVGGVRVEGLTLQVAEALVAAQGGGLAPLDDRPGYAVELLAAPPA